jgi:hypoxanthine phosphoribosyltransferase
MESSELRSPSKTKVLLTHDKFVEAINYLVDQIKLFEENRYKFTGIVPIPRGGLVPATYLSHRLKIPICSIESLDGHQYDGSPILWVDDIIDTGYTLTSLNFRMVKDDRVATLFTKPWADVVPNFYYDKTEDWLIFPWEVE